MDLTSYIIIVVFLFFIITGGVYLITSLAGPKKIEEVENLMQRGRFKDAINNLNQLLEKDDRNMRAIYLLSKCYRQIGDSANAILYLRQCIKIGKFSPEVKETMVREDLAHCLLDMGNHTEAKNEFLILTTIDPGQYEYFYEVGKLFYKAGLFQKSLKFLEKAVKLNGRHQETRAYLGRACYKMGTMNYYQEGKIHLLSAVDLDQSDNESFYYLGLVMRQLQDHEGAMKALEKASRDENLRGRAMLARGMVLLDQKNFPAAIAEFERGLKSVEARSENWLQLHYMAGQAAEVSRDMHSAIDHWETINQVKPDYRDVAKKLQQYSEFRTDDSIKDFMIASGVQFETICRKIVENLGFSISESEPVKDTGMLLLGSEQETLKTTQRKYYTLFFIQRDLTAVTETQIRDFQDKMKTRSANNGYFITTGEFSPGALDFAANRPLHLYDASKLAGLIKGAI